MDSVSSMDMASILSYASCMTAAAPISAEIVPIGKRAATRARICEATSTLFFNQGFAAVTMEEIAAAVGIRRSTLYLHFRDKDEILAAIAEDYTAKLRDVIARLPAPEPSREEIATWVGAFAHFVSREPGATELLVSLSHLPKAPPPALAFGGALQKMMAERSPAFRRALEPGQTLAYAWSVAAMDGLGWALCHHARTGGDALSEARLAVAAEQLNRFVRGAF
jgi:AcrR family transcriptional regulator